MTVAGIKALLFLLAFGIVLMLKTVLAVFAALVCVRHNDATAFWRVYDIKEEPGIMKLIGYVPGVMVYLLVVAVLALRRYVS